MEELQALDANTDQIKWENKLVEYLGLDPKYAMVVEESYEAYAKSMERETGIPWKSYYVSYLSKLIINLSPTSYLNDENPAVSPLLEKLRQGRMEGKNISPDSYDPSLLPHLSNYDLSTNSHEIKTEIELRKNQEVQVKYSQDYTCSKCKEKKTKEYRLQARSGDEGYTYKAECINCGFSWRLN